jgi:hypothetical protein
LRSHYNDEESSWLVLDCYSVHRTHEIKKGAEELGTQLVLIPAGITQAHQPLDPHVRGSSRRPAGECTELLCDDISAKRTKRLALEFLVRAWEMITLARWNDPGKDVLTTMSDSDQITRAIQLTAIVRVEEIFGKDLSD